jgi:hypothetical protein
MKVLQKVKTSIRIPPHLSQLAHQLADLIQGETLVRKEVYHD